MELGLTQEHLANSLGLHEMTINNWETKRSLPAVRLMPRIIEFLGYSPFPPSEYLPEKLIAGRRSLGPSQKKLAKVLRVDESSLRTWESGHRKPSGRCAKIIGAFVADNNEQGVTEPPVS
jgi:DNA-binding transcriptional regulator YiaG